MLDLLKYSIATVAVLVGFYFASDEIYDDLTSQSKSLQKLWQQDIAKLQTEKALPVGLNNIREIEWVTPDTISKTWRRYAKPPFHIKPDGEYRLELLVLSQNDEGDSLKAVIQHHLIHIATGNSVWELGRTYSLSSP